MKVRPVNVFGHVYSYLFHGYILQVMESMHGRKGILFGISMTSRRTQGSEDTYHVYHVCACTWPARCHIHIRARQGGMFAYMILVG